MEESINTRSIYEIEEDVLNFCYHLLCQTNVVTKIEVNIFIEKTATLFQDGVDLKQKRYDFLNRLGLKILDNICNVLMELNANDTIFTTLEMKCISETEELSVCKYKNKYRHYIEVVTEDDYPYIKIPDPLPIKIPYYNIPSNIVNLIRSIYKTKTSSDFIKVYPKEELRDVHRFLSIYNFARNAFHNLSDVYFSIYEEKMNSIEDAISFLNDSIRFFNRFII